MDHDPLALAAVEPLRSGMTVGLGTGRASARAIRALAERARRDRLDLLCVATSEASGALAASLGLKVHAADDAPELDYLFDGADEVDPGLRMIKGRGGAMTREKILARLSARCVYLVQRSKVVPRLGAHAPLPIEVLRFGLAGTLRQLVALGLAGRVRVDERGGEYRTDNGNPVIDAPIPSDMEPGVLRERLDDLPGVVGHGLFLSEADEVLVEEQEGGAVTRLTRG